MDVYLVVRRAKMTLFLEAKESWTIQNLKEQIAGILNISPENQRLYKDETLLEDAKTLADCGFNSGTAKAQSPALLALSCSEGSDEFEPVTITEYSKAPELPDVMKPQAPPATSKPE